MLTVGTTVFCSVRGVFFPLPPKAKVPRQTTGRAIQTFVTYAKLG